MEKLTLDFFSIFLITHNSPPEALATEFEWGYFLYLALYHRTIKARMAELIICHFQRLFKFTEFKFVLSKTPCAS